MNEIVSVRQELKLMQEALLSRGPDDGSGEIENEVDDNEADLELENQKKKNNPVSDDEAEITEITEVTEPIEPGFDAQKALPQVFAKLRIPKENQELLLKIIKGDAQNLNEFKDEKELLAHLQKTVTQHPILARSTQYKPLSGTSGNQRAKKPDVSKMSIKERNQLFSKRLDEIV